MTSTSAPTQILDPIAAAGCDSLISFILDGAGTELDPGRISLPDRQRQKAFS
ncbi:MAG: hypothetical protein ACR2QK_01675 [Acidimicrobiales bacterium]